MDAEHADNDDTDALRYARAVAWLRRFNILALASDMVERIIH